MTQRASVLACLAAGMTLAGCGHSSPESGAGKSGTGEFPAYVAQAESTFRPSDFGVETWTTDAGEGKAGEPADTGGTVEAAAPDTIPGFRVQVAITEDIDYAGGVRDSLLAALPGEWVYIVYHPPYYKVRVGNFGERHVAGNLLEELRRMGYPDAWIVPDRVSRNPGPRPSPPPADTAASEPPPR